MKHTIRFREDVTFTVVDQQDGTRKQRTKQQVRAGDVFEVLIKPRVVDFVELADLMVSDGSEVIGVPYKFFQFVDVEKG